MARRGIIQRDDDQARKTVIEALDFGQAWIEVQDQLPRSVGVRSLERELEFTLQYEVKEWFG